MKAITSLTYIIILNYNSCEETVHLFQNLQTQINRSVKIIVIDNNSIEKDRARLKKEIPSQYLIINEENIGYAGGNNVGIDIALKDNADYVWLLNPDIRVNKFTLSILVETLQNDSSLAAVGPRIIHRRKPELIFSDGELLSLENCKTWHKNHNLEVQNIHPSIDYDIDYIDGSSILLNCNALKEIGKLSEEYFLYFEETDWCFKAKKNNWKLAVNSNALVQNLTSSKEETFHYYMFRNRLIFARKYHPCFPKIRNMWVQEVLQEIKSRFRGKYLKPYFRSRVKGLFSGLIKTM